MYVYILEQYITLILSFIPNGAFQTLFTVSSKVEASGSGGEFCRAGSMCHLCLTVMRVLPSLSPNPPPQLMYEVLADQTMWAVCGRTAGIVSLEIVEKQSVTLDVMPLTSGYLPLPVVRLSRYIPATESKNGEFKLFLYILIYNVLYLIGAKLTKFF